MENHEITLSSPLEASKTMKPTLRDVALKRVADLIKILPTGTVFFFQCLSPLVTLSGHCAILNKYMTAALIVVCSFSCCFSCFTDSYIEADGKLYYGIVTPSGMWLFLDPYAKASRDLTKYKLRVGDFVHAALSVLVFAVIALLDKDTLSCFYPSFAFAEDTLTTVLPPVVGSIASLVFMVYPNNRHGIGYTVAAIQNS